MKSIEIEDFDNENDNDKSSLLKTVINTNKEKNNNYTNNNNKNYNYIKIIHIAIVIFIFLIPIKNLKVIELDNKISLYEKNINFSSFSTDIKTIALYLPQFHTIKENDEWWGKGFTEWTNVKKGSAFFVGHNQPRIPLDKPEYLGYYDLSKLENIKKQVELAKSHGIYGFGIYYYWFSGKKLLEKPIDLFYENKDIDFKFLLIWANENWTRQWDGLNKEILIKQEYKDEDPENFIIDIKKYLMDSRYIKINGKRVIGLYDIKKIPKLKETISIWRQKSRQYGIGEIFVLITLNALNYSEIKNMELFDGTYQFSPRENVNYTIKDAGFFLYTSSLYNNFNSFNLTNDFPLYMGSMLEWDNSPRRKKLSTSIIFKYYSPEQFYLVNKIKIERTRKLYNKNNYFLFINAWNEWGEGTYLEPDTNSGYASINSLSKAIFNLPYMNNYNIANLKENCLIAVQAHIYYEDLINEIFDKIKNIPAKFDLFITTDTSPKKDIIEKYLQNNNILYNKYNITVIENKGRDTLPLLEQFKNYTKNYKYLCHIHTKKFFYLEKDPEKSGKIGETLRNYLYNNLLGNKEIVSEILTDLENNDDLGIIFTEQYYKILLDYGEKIPRNEMRLMKVLINNIFPGYKIGENIEYPYGNMFWAKIDSIHQMFEHNLLDNFPAKNRKEDKLSLTIERIWTYLVKYNGYKYKKILKHI
jgi:lipopolysaccharide biosynthesis protein